jgi:murein L,D-transpeptidase YafK
MDRPIPHDALSDGSSPDELLPGMPDRRHVCRGLSGLGLVSCGVGAAVFAPGPAQAENWAAGKNALHIIVSKSARRLMLVRAGDAFLTAPVALGAHPKGAKYQVGDGRTPEGDYVIDGFNSQSRYYRALHISYPNAEDMRRAAAAGRSPGGNIEIHGMPDGFGDYDPASFSRDWTDGCIAVSNRVIDMIWRNVALDTPVDIRA